MNTTNITIKQLLKAGVHLGHETSNWNPKMFPYIYKENNNTHIINLFKTIESLKKAKNFVQRLAKDGKTFLFIGTKLEAQENIAKQALKCNSFYINYRWLGGMLSNWETLQSRLVYLKKLEEQEIYGTFNILSKKERVLRKKELENLRQHFNGIKNIKSLPDVAIVIDQNFEMAAIKECRSLNIPVISLIDTTCDPDLIDIFIPGNDDGTESIKLILEYLATNILLGQQQKI
jgi:small subunit ribosomal protein S2